VLSPKSKCGDSRPRLSLERSSRAFAGPQAERGYVLLTLLLIVALLSIAAATAASSIAFKIRRDREEELIHRGAQYSRAIRSYTKKVGHYPLRLEDLENTNGLRFLRKRYKDPITGQDFKLLHMTDLQKIGVGGLGASIIPGVAPGGAAPGGFGQPGSQLGSQFGSQPGPQVSSANAFGANPSSGQSPFGQGAPAAQFGQPASQVDPSASNPGATGPTGDGTNGDGPNPQGLNNAGQSAGQSAAQPSDAQAADSSQPIGGVIVGVASLSKDKTIREFNHKNHYTDWLFFYDPAYDRGFLITGPTQMSLPTFTNPAVQQPGAQQPGSPQPAAQPPSPTQSPTQ